MMRILIACFTAVVMLLALWMAPRTDSKAPPASSRQWLKIVFGADGKAASWDGSLSIQKGSICTVSPWAFEQRDQLKQKDFSWKITTGIPKAKRVTYAEPQRGLLLEWEGEKDCVLKVATKQGAFQVQPAKLITGRSGWFLIGRAKVERLGSASVVAETKTDDDFVAIAVDEQGHRHVGWIAYDAKKRANLLLVRDVDEPLSKPEILARGRECSSLHLVSDSHGSLLAIWCAPDASGDWNIFYGRNQGRGWQVDRVTTAKGTDFRPAVALSSSDELWITWQSFRDGNGNIYAQRLSQGEWLPKDLCITSHPSNQWQPSIAVDRKGRAWIAYDSYEHGNYDVFLRSVSLDKVAAKVSKPVAIAQSRDFEAHASVAIDREDRVWVAYDAAGPRWGKDFRNVPTMEGGKYAEPLHASRRLELRCVINGKVFEPKDPLPQILPPRPIRSITRKASTKPSRFYEYPQLALDGNNRLWLFFRMNRQGYCPHPPLGIDWKIYATTWTTKGWLEPIELPQSQGRQNQRVAVAIGPEKRLCCAWSQGNRFASVDQKYVAYSGCLPPVSEAAAPLPLKPWKAPRPGKAPKAPAPPFTLKKGKEEYHLYYGDLHRHTSISRCSPTIDGCLTDAHRYALDAAELDFLAITDHTRDVDPFSWWRTQQAADHFHIPGGYIPIYGYERSNQNPTGGHRNVFFLERGWDVNPSDHWYLGRGLKPKATRPDTTLYPWMKKGGAALTAAHTPAYVPKSRLGTWTYHDPQVEPVAEIYQSFRRSYERPDKGVREEASLWHALKKGHKLGFIASSDHMATHTSYACVWAKGKSRKAIFEAIQARRTFAATDRIALVTRIGDAIMGEEARHVGESVTLSIRAKGTAAIREVQVVRSGKVIATFHPEKQELSMEYTDRKPLPGESYYYVRLVQRDGERAWASPIWIR